MLTVLTGVHVALTLALIGLVLVQRGKGADVGAAFGSGASQTMFGSAGAASFLTRTTAVVATLFFVSSLTLAYLASQRDDGRSVADAAVSAAVAPIEDVVVEEVVPADVPMLPQDTAPAE